jgi:protein phosphatase
MKILNGRKITPMRSNIVKLFLFICITALFSGVLSGTIAAQVITPAGTIHIPPEATSEPPQATTEAEETTSEPEEITAEPEEAASESEETTAEPSETTAAPSETTAVTETTESEESDITEETSLFGYVVFFTIIGVIIIVAVAAVVIVVVMRTKKGAGAKVSKIPVTLVQPVMTDMPVVNKVSVSVGNAYHIGMRDSQQDSFAISDLSNTDLYSRKGVFGIVADGMGGMAGGGEASAIVTKTCLQYFNEIELSAQPGLDLLNMMYAANENVTRFMAEREKGGSTAVAVIINGGNLYWASVGDSRIYLIRGGAITQMNREDTYAVELDEKAASGETSWEEAATDSKRGALTNFLGIGKLEKVDRSLRPTKLLNSDRILLMSDGVFGVLTDEEIIGTMSLSPQESAMKLQELTLAKQNPNQDNLTAVIFEFKGE